MSLVPHPLRILFIGCCCCFLFSFFFLLSEDYLISSSVHESFLCIHACWSPRLRFSPTVTTATRMRKEAFVGGRRRWRRRRQQLLLWMNGSGRRLTCRAAELIRNFGLLELDEFPWAWAWMNSGGAGSFNGFRGLGVWTSLCM
jgi:hypothetical protein